MKTDNWCIDYPLL